MAKRRVTEIMSESYRLGEILVEPESSRDGTADLRYLQGMRQASPVVITSGRQKYLSLVLHAAKCLGVQYAVAVTLIAWAYIAGRFFGVPASAVHAQ